ncbi:MAG TPA: hypothetical protein VHM20_03455 [Gammaproteobacteria bacterium]|jgi:predicted lactoylglutathione lyase|nr:hypothetical protein [Gammaproteobacteria bacterium]
MQNNDSVIVNLTAPTVFADLNQTEGKALDYAREMLVVARLKFKHFKQMQKLGEAEQMQHAISALTGLSEKDVDELYAEDAAEITKVIYGFMGKYLELAKKMMDDSAK